MKNNVVILSSQGLDRVKAFSDVYNRPNSSTFCPDFFQWQYVDSEKLFGGKDNGFYVLETEDQTVLSYCAASNAPYKFSGQSELGRFFHEWFTNPACSGVGLSLLAKQIESGPILHVAGASMSTLNVFLRMRKTIWLQLDRLVAVLSPPQVSKLVSSLNTEGRRILSAIVEHGAETSDSGTESHQNLRRFDERYEEIWKNISNQFNLCVDRTSQYMNWRYFGHPSFHYSVWQFGTDRKPVYFIWRKEIEKKYNIAIARICDVIGDPLAIERETPKFLNALKVQNVALVDFFCSNGGVNDSLLAGGFHKSITLPNFDIPRLFSPLADDSRKTLHMALSFSEDIFEQGLRKTSLSYFTKSDANQDRPNP